jgi:Ser/Thr protein kinase RdoA (MazF antagonist)
LTLSHRYVPAIQSILDPQALLAQIDADYDRGTLRKCTLWRPGLNDTYIVKTAESAYILKIYQTQGRTQSEIHYELDVLNHLSQNKAPVAVPIERSDGTYLFALDAPEGVRYGALFSYAEGDAPFPKDQEKLDLFFPRRS